MPEVYITYETSYKQIVVAHNKCPCSLMVRASDGVWKVMVSAVLHFFLHSTLCEKLKVYHISGYGLILRKLELVAKNAESEYSSSS